ncbi:unnamed protein product, partial [Ectocarpus sp. 13 AM-2016]
VHEASHQDPPVGQAPGSPSPGLPQEDHAALQLPRRGRHAGLPALPLRQRQRLPRLPRPGGRGCHNILRRRHYHRRARPRPWPPPAEENGPGRRRDELGRAGAVPHPGYPAGGADQRLVPAGSSGIGAGRGDVR